MARCIIHIPSLFWLLIGLVNCTRSPYTKSGQTVFISSADGYLHALDATTGKSKWQQKLGNTHIEAAPIVANELVILGTSTETGICAFDVRTGTLKWKQSLPDGLIFSARVANKTIFALASSKAFWDFTGTNFTTLYALDVDTGKLIWSFQAGNQKFRAALSNSDENCPLVHDGMIYFGGSDGLFYAINADTGSQKWSYPAGVAFYSSPLWIDGTVYAGDANGSLLALDGASGKLKWKIHDSHTIHAGIATDNKLLFVPYDGPASLSAYSPVDGSKRWSFTPTNFISSSPTVANGVLYTSAEDGLFCALNTHDGVTKWKTSLYASRITVPTIVQDVIYIGGGTTMYALDANTGQKKWTFAAQGNIIKSACVQLQDGTVFRGLGDIQP